MVMRHAQPSSGAVLSRKDSRPSTPAQDRDNDSDHGRPSFSIDATPRPTPSQSRPLGQDSNTLTTVDTPPHSKRLGFFADKLSGASSSQHHHQQSASTSGNRPSPVPSHPNTGLLPPRSHSRADSTRDPSSTMASSSSAANASKVHSSPSKVSPDHRAYQPMPCSNYLQSTTGRTYDSRLVSREMHRLGNLSHLPGHLPASLSAAALASTSTLTLPATVSSSTLPSSLSERDNPWGALHVHVLPLFNGEPLRVPMLVSLVTIPLCTDADRLSTLHSQ
jgi:hypothetical protein